MSARLPTPRPSGFSLYTTSSFLQHSYDAGERYVPSSLSEIGLAHMSRSGQHAASPFMNSPALPGAISQPSPDKEYPTSSWNFDGLALPSRAVTPALSAGRSTPQDHVTVPREHFEQLLQYYMSSRSGTSSGGSPAPSNASSFSPTQTQLSLSRPATPDVPKSKRIPRPPNAFMLYRSHLLKTRQIPTNVEHRQQNISRVAGQCWNMLSEEEKRVWHEKAKEVLSAHMAKYPGYKFSPERKASRRKTPQDADAPALHGEAWIVHLREKYLHKRGPAPEPSRNRSSRSRRGVGTDGPSSLSLPPSLQASPASSPGAAPNLSAPASVSSSPAMRPFPSGDTAQWGSPFDMPPFPNLPPQQILDQFPLPTGEASPVDNDVVCLFPPRPQKQLLITYILDSEGRYVRRHPSSH